MIAFKVRQQSITHRNPTCKVVAGSRDYLHFVFDFSEDWNGVVKTALFSNDSLPETLEQPVAVVLVDDEITPERCPDSIFAVPGTVTVSVFGGDLITVDKCEIVVCESGYNAQSVAPTEPASPDSYVKTPAGAPILYMRQNNGDAQWYDGTMWHAFSSENGKSAYEIAVELGFSGDEAAWLASLEGEPGPAGQNFCITATYPSMSALEADYPTPTEGLFFAVGVEGNYEIVTYADGWINLGPLGAAGANGLSAYQQAQNAGYAGTEAQFSAALAGYPAHLSAGNPHSITCAKIGALPTTGGTLSGDLVAHASSDYTSTKVRNCVIVPAGTDVASLTVVAGTLIFVEEA